MVPVTTKAFEEGAARDGWPPSFFKEILIHSENGRKRLEAYRFPEVSFTATFGIRKKIKEKSASASLATCG